MPLSGPVPSPQSIRATRSSPEREEIVDAPTRLIGCPITPDSAGEVITVKSAGTGDGVGGGCRVGVGVGGGTSVGVGVGTGVAVGRGVAVARTTTGVGDGTTMGVGEGTITGAVVTVGRGRGLGAGVGVAVATGVAVGRSANGISPPFPVSPPLEAPTAAIASTAIEIGVDAHLIATLATQ